MVDFLANLALMAAYTIGTALRLTMASKNCWPKHTQLLPDIPKALTPRLHRAALYRQHEEWELAALDLQAAIKISGADDPVVMLGQAELDLAQGRAAEAVPLLLQLLTKTTCLWSPTTAWGERSPK